MISAERDGEPRTSSGIPLRLLYGPDDAKAEPSQPGQRPFLRGAYPQMYRGKPWRIFQLSGFGNPEDEGERIRFLLDHGETGFIMEHDRNIADHLYDVDHPDVVARHEDVGLVGAVILSLDDYETVLKGIDIGNVYAHPGGGVVQHAPFTLACYWSVAQRRGLALTDLPGTSQADFFLTYLGCITKQQIPTAAGLRMNVDTIEFCGEHMPHWTPISIAGYNGADSGLNGYQELGAVMANAAEYLDAVAARGRMDPAAAARGAAGVNFRVSMELFEDIAKMRAARVMWTELLERRYGIRDDKAARLRIHSLTAGSQMTYQQPLNNIARGTLMALAGVLGGTQSLGVSGYDEAVSIPSEHAHQMSVRIQQILQNEANLTAVADPLGGSYYVEALTDEVKQRAWAFFDEIQEEGGFLATLDSGWLHARALENQAGQLAAIDSGERRVVGVNFAEQDESPFEIDGFAGTSDAWERGMERIGKLRRERESRRHAEAMRNLASVCAGDDNILPPMIEAVLAGATVGEIGDVFRTVFGDWTPPIEF
ncbi:MAG TPA: acyl-CoA mutase large subunit family protein [Amycolatopsis sp.]|nr:acyl-CoA mutase large subunit family protein [Amycolatopsis sp.]